MMKFIATGLALLAYSIHLAEGGGFGQLLDPDCGTTKEGITERIAGGTNADPLSNPWMVYVTGEVQCGGSLITNRFVLTAAHCIVDSNMSVRLGEYDTQNPRKDCNRGVCVLRVYTVEVDLKFVHSDNRDEYKYDIGLLRMKTAVQYSDYVRPICFLVNGHLQESTSFNITGWGITNNKHTSQTLQTAMVYNVDPELCSKKFMNEVDESQICASNENRDACSGDSGGPLSAQIARDGRLLTFQYGIISYGSKKCNSHTVYTNVTYYREWILSTIESASLLEENCGTVARGSRVRRLVGGHDAGRLSHPWMVRLHTYSSYVCGGSLITSRFVLTSAVCVDFSKPMTALLGGHDMDLPHTFLEVPIDRKIVQPQFDPRNPLKHDIALLQMMQEVPFSDHIRPICLSINQPLERVQSYTLTGWGVTGDGDLSRILQETSLVNVDPSICNRTFSGQIDRSHICTFGVNGDACTGDSGGPLSAELPYNGTKRAFLLGIVSIGLDSCRGYGLSTNVSHYLDWIKNTIEEN
ncbi:coagulation factor IX isoform X2 [Drosophila santomea]|uniref:coagulation factor IX isoform X2 n=1 Tax=Drosophila santomea TaxID=129105 RepID=UPI001954B9AC|nr:coagulation factor IX isoform X2 [Drosophila santomea]